MSYGTMTQEPIDEQKPGLLTWQDIRMCPLSLPI